MTAKYKQIATAIVAYKNCVQSDNLDWKEYWETAIERIGKTLPSGSGFDSGSSIDLDASNKNKIVIVTSFHHMDENGYYDQWTDHTVIVRPDLISDFDLRITGRNYRDIKEYMYQVFESDLREPYYWPEHIERYNAYMATLPTGSLNRSWTVQDWLDHGQPKEFSSP